MVYKCWCFAFLKLLDHPARMKSDIRERIIQLSRVAQSIAY